MCEKYYTYSKQVIQKEFNKGWSWISDQRIKDVENEGDFINDLDFWLSELEKM